MMYRLKHLLKGSVLCLGILLPVYSTASSALIDSAEAAAVKGDYRLVVRLLSEALDSQELGAGEQVVAHANRGIAYSLLGAYGRARLDLEAAIALNPGHTLTQNHLGILAEHVDGNYEVAARWYAQAANAGFSAARVNLAKLYRSGRVPVPDGGIIRQLLEDAVAEGYTAANPPLAELLLEGGGDNRARALRLLEAAEDAGIPEAVFVRGVDSESRGQLAEAAAHYERAARAGHPEAQNALGFLYRRGAGVPQDFVAAVNWYQLAADQGHLEATNRLAWLLATCPVETVCNGPVALSLASTVVSQWRTPGTLDSLAAAYARTGDFDNAIRTIGIIVDEFGADGARYRNRLERYENGVPYQL